MNLLIIDTETTGIDSETDEITEIGAALYSVEYQTTLAQVSYLMPVEGDTLKHITGIPEGAGFEIKSAIKIWGALACLREMADYYIAHNADFDKSMLKWHDDKTPWLCTYNDFPWKPQSLVSLALEHDVGVSHAHRALTDCQLIARIFDKRVDLQADIEYAARPRALYQALVSYNDRQLAKDADFRWQADQKLWTRRMACDDVSDLPFEVREIAQE